MKNIIEKAVLGLALLLAIIVGPALSSAYHSNQGAAVLLAAGTDYSILNPLNKDQLIDVIKCLTNGTGIGLPKCVAKVTQPSASSTAATMSMGGSDVQIRSSNYRITGTAGVSKATMINFMVDSYGGSGTIKTLPVGFNGNVFPTAVYLFDGNTLVASKTGGADVIFDNINLAVPINTQKILTIKADYPSTTLNGARSAAFVAPGTYEKLPGITATMGGAPIDGRVQYFFHAVAKYRPTSVPTITTPPSSSSTPYMLATFPLAVQADGGTVQIPMSNGSDFGVMFTNGSNMYAASAKSVVTIPNQNIADGTISSVTVTAHVAGANIPTSGLYNAMITSIKWNAGSGVVTQTWGLEDFKTIAPATFVK